MTFDGTFSAALPIDEVLPQITDALAKNPRAILVAPPGAGKTTRVPLALLNADFIKGGRILVLEPRRLAARAAADRMAATLGERLGERVGLRVRMESKISARTRIEVITEGVFTRMILDDPALEGVSAVLFDEFHERSLDADLGLALALDAQAGLREDLRLLVMSATLDGVRVSTLMENAPVIASEGRAFPVDTIYLGRDSSLDVVEAATRAIMRALEQESGSVLAFLPGQGEILRTAERLQERVRVPEVDIAPLFGAMERGAQDKAVSPAPPGRRKIVLATSIAETSITIEGVRVVVDCGLVRAPRYEPDVGVTRLETMRVSRAAADQRRGRAGRTQPGVCYRLWEEAGNGALQAYATPEILSADLSGLLLDCAQWGAREPASLRWLDPPPAGALNEARALLMRLGALDGEGAITAQGRKLRALPLPPRLARMVTGAADIGLAKLAADLAAVASERGLGGDDVDLAERVRRMRSERTERAKAARAMADGWSRMAARSSEAVQFSADQDVSECGRLLALAWPDRIAKARGSAGEFLMANGRAGAVEPHRALAREPYIVVVDLTGRAGAARIVSAAAISPEEIEACAGAAIDARDEIVFERSDASVKVRRVRKLGALTLASQPLPAKGPEAARVLAEGLAAQGLSRLPWSKAQKQWRDRVNFLRSNKGEEDWPDLSDEALSASVGQWLAPCIEGRSSLAAIQPDDLEQALRALLPWDLQRRLDIEAPTHFEAPTGSHIAIDYESEGAPVLAVRVQELYGLNQHPSLARGRAPLTLHLLSPAHRPIQITRDLPGFWRGSWAAVKSDMKGRYPRHLWPDDPANAAPTMRAKPRGT
jgi:ATP-dependent helicase HrpB